MARDMDGIPDASSVEILVTDCSLRDFFPIFCSVYCPIAVGHVWHYAQLVWEERADCIDLRWLFILVSLVGYVL